MVKGVLFGVQTYWSQIFILPKKILKDIEIVCSVFLWTGQNPSRKALVFWQQFNLPKSSGGWNIILIAEWNKADVIKLLWALSFKVDNLWVK